MKNQDCLLQFLIFFFILKVGGIDMKQGVLMQYFEWYLPSQPFLFQKIQEDAKHLHDIGITALWLPPAYKGMAGNNDVGYGVYDLYDLGEFDQKGSIPTKYGTKEDYLKAIQTLHQYHIQVYGDIVFDHKMGADGYEDVKASEVNQKNRYDVEVQEEWIRVPTLFTFPQRHQKYSDFTWDWTCFDGIDYDAKTKRHATFLFQDKNWDTQVDDENGNYDYLMGADLDFSNPRVVEELERWGKWYWDTTHLDGFRLDALKHIRASFFCRWLDCMREYTHQELFTVGEYWHGDVQKLLHYLNQVGGRMSLFDVPLHYHFYEASHSFGEYDMSKIFEGTLVQKACMNAVTFVDNHDTQPQQGLQSWVMDWFKPLAYALILLRKDGYPCVFYGDYYGIAKPVIKGQSEILDKLLYLRKHYAYGQQNDYFYDRHIIGWTREMYGLACVMTNQRGGILKMYVGISYCHQIFYDYLGHHQQRVEIDEQGYGVFPVNDGSVSVYIMQNSGD